jgi:hypothetical protein
MRSTIITLFATLFTTISTAQTAILNTNSSLVLTINGSIVKGSTELAPQMRGKTQAEIDIISESAIFPIKINDSFQLKVEIVGKTGVRTDITGSNRLRYQHFGCLTISTQGFTSVSPAASCSGPEYPTLHIIYSDADGRPSHMNEYLFRVTQ